MNFGTFNSLSNISHRNFMVSDHFTTSSTLIPGKSCFLRVDFVPNVMNSVFSIVCFEVILMHLNTKIYNI